ncbi:serine/threonine-protein kinase [Kitasatospora camelliae]|uniref:Serine/threonine-protein kinase n=1 Tax=Kitasatospora camelliae TaxID=3156397 RepID=A0AAU8JTD8_9ACTN
MKPLRPEDPREVAGYRLLARIGEGGMGAVFLSRTRGHQPVALKVIRREYAEDEEFRRRFEHEVRSARQVQGYHIVPVLDHDTGGDQPWLATAYVPGLSLDAALAVGGPLAVDSALQLAGCVAEALRSIHAAGVIHRDLKPSNVLLGGDGPFVIDFGIARAADATQLTRSGGLVGTPQYMSPEHAEGLSLTPATDVFSLGLVLAVAATGRHPYGDGGAITLATKIANTAVRPPDLGGYPEPLRGVLERCLAADPEARPGAAELAVICEKAAGRPPREFAGRLPEAVAAEIARRELAVREVDEPVAVGGAFGTTHLPGPTRPPQPAQPPQVTGAPQPTGGPAQAAPALGNGDGDGRAKRSKGRLVLVTVVAAAVVIAGATWKLTRDKGDATGGRTGGPAAAAPPEGSAPAAAQSSAGAAQSGAAQPGASGSASASAKSTRSAAPSPGYKLVFEKRPLTIRPAGLTNYTQVDLDIPKVDPAAQNYGGKSEMQYLEGSGDAGYLEFLKGTGVSQGDSEAACREAAEANPLARQLKMKELAATFTAGTRLCTVTSEKNLAMFTVSGLTPRAEAYDITGELTLWSMP